MTVKINIEDNAAIESLKKFICNNVELSKLEEKYKKFNIFDCLGVNKQELKHSNFLAWLFNPRLNQGIGDFFVKEFLKNVLINDQNPPSKNKPSVFDIDCFDMTDIEVIREYKNIDIFILDEKNKFLCVIENKIYSKENNNQCQNYHKAIEEKEKFKEYKKLYVYLKPTLDDDISDKSFIPIEYKEIINILSNIISRKMVNQNLLIVLQDYKDLLNRDILKDEDKKKLCSEIYKKHKNSIKLLNNICINNEELQTKICDKIHKKIKEKGFIIFKEKNKRWINFTHNSLRKYEKYFSFVINNDTKKNFIVDIRFKVDNEVSAELKNIYKNCRTKENVINKIIDEDTNEKENYLYYEGKIEEKLNKIDEYLSEEKIKDIKSVLEKKYPNIKDQNRSQEVKGEFEHGKGTDKEDISNSVKEIYRKVYKNHKQAIDIIIDNININDLQYALSRFLIEYLESIDYKIEKYNTRNISFRRKSNSEICFYIVNNTNNENNGYIKIRQNNNKWEDILTKDDFKTLPEEFEYNDCEIPDACKEKIKKILNNYLSKDKTYKV